MSAFYSILYASIRKATQEKLSLGLLLFGDKTVYFKFSPQKLTALKAFLPKEDYQLIHQSINAVKNSILSHSKIVNQGSQSIYEMEHTGFSLEYVNYLSRYKNNLVTYSEPKAIAVEVTSDNMLKLYDTLIGLEIEHIIPGKLTPVERIRTRFNGKIEKHFNLNYILTSERVPDLLVPVKVDLLGKNGSDVLVRVIDTASGPEKISNEVSTFYLLTEAYRKNHLPVKDFIMAEEPMHRFKKQHSIWRQIKDSSCFTYLDLSEADKLREFAETNHVRPIADLDTDLPF